MRESGTQVVAGVSPGKGGTVVDGIPVFDSMISAVSATGGDCVACFVPAPGVLDAALEAAEAGVSLVVVMAEFVAMHDAIRARAALDHRGCRMIGPNTNGVVTPGQATVGFFPKQLCRPGRIGIASRSGTMTYGASIGLIRAGFGQSTVVGVGGDAVRGIGFTECVELFNRDSETDVILLLGEVGGDEEELAAAYVASNPSKPVVAVVVGRCAIPGTSMGHAGALVTSSSGSVVEKERALTSAGILVARNLGDIPVLVQDALNYTTAALT
jgi:succinyl-CoA synthetase alpha subunit